MLGGFITTVAWVLWLKPHFYDLLEVIPGFIVGLILTVTISNLKSGKPYLDLLPHKDDHNPRIPGRFKGQIELSDDFNETSEEIIAAFEGHQSMDAKK